MTREERNENKFVCWLVYVYLSRQMIVHFLKTALGLWPPNLQKARSSNNINTSHVNTNYLLFILSLRYSVSVIPSFVFFNLTHLIFILQSFSSLFFLSVAGYCCCCCCCCSSSSSSCSCSCSSSSSSSCTTILGPFSLFLVQSQRKIAELRLLV